MIKKNFNHSKAIYVVTIVGILSTASGVCAEERLPASEALSERTKEFLSDPGRTGSLLGSILAGAAVANPLAPLLGSVAGFMIGKSSAFTNKDSNATRRQAYINRSLIPQDGVQVTSLAGLTGKQPQASDQAITLGLSGETGTGNRSEQTEQTVTLGLSGETGTGNRSEQAESVVITGLSGDTGTGNRLEQAEPVVIVGLPGIRTGNQSEQTEHAVTLASTGKAGAGRNLQQQLAYACSNVQLAQPLSVSCYSYSQ